jgi:hypothetical protein
MPRLLFLLLCVLLLGERAQEAAALTGVGDPDRTAPPAAGSTALPVALPEPDPPADPPAGAAPDAEVGPLPSEAERSAAAAIISGSRRPGIIEHSLIRGGADVPGLHIHINYPSVGSKEIDADIRQWVTGLAEAFAANATALTLPGEDDAPPNELWGSYTVAAPSPAGLSLTFEIWTYTGGAHGNLDVLTLNYSLLTGQRLGLVDLFEDPEAALRIMSDWAYKELSQRLGGMRQEQTLRTGLTPVPENFASLTLVPQGVRINFQPYQVAPWAAGAQKVTIPLEELLPARPLLRLWGR